jgi:hypothetical protein
MGVTIGDKDALAAHEFGEELSLVEDQVGKVAIKIGIALMPTSLIRWRPASAILCKEPERDRRTGPTNLRSVVDRVVKGAEVVIGKLEKYYTGYKHRLYAGIGLGFLVPKPGLFGFFAPSTLITTPTTQQPSRESRALRRACRRADLPDVYGKGDQRSRQRKATTSSESFSPTRDFTSRVRSATQLNKGSLHPLGLAADVSVRGKTEDEIAKLIAASIEKGYRLVDERKKIPGVYQTGPHLHFERNGSEKASIFQDASMYGSVPLGYLQSLDKARLGKGPGGSTAITEFNKKELDLDIKDFETYWDRKLEIEQAGNNNLMALKEVEMDAIKQGGCRLCHGDCKRIRTRNAQAAAVSGRDRLSQQARGLLPPQSIANDRPDDQDRLASQSRRDAPKDRAQDDRHPDSKDQARQRGKGRGQGTDR